MINRVHHTTFYLLTHVSQGLADELLTGKYSDRNLTIVTDIHNYIINKHNRSFEDKMWNINFYRPGGWSGSI